MLKITLDILASKLNILFALLVYMIISETTKIYRAIYEKSIKLNGFERNKKQQHAISKMNNKKLLKKPHKNLKQ